MSRQRGMGCEGAFLDLKKAYDMVSREKLFGILREEGYKESWIDVLKEIYGDSRVLIKGRVNSSAEYGVVKGVRQGCPLSPIIFLFYIERFAREIYQSGLGWQVGEGSVHVRIPILLFADDMVLLGQSCVEVQKMLDICSMVTDKMTWYLTKRRAQCYASMGFLASRSGHCRANR